jgi:hypothetical protein
MTYTRRVCHLIEDYLVAFAPVDRVVRLSEITGPGQVYKIVQNQEGELRYRLIVDRDKWMDNHFSFRRKHV